MLPKITCRNGCYAKKLFVTIYGYLRDEMKPSIDTAKKLADALDVTLDYLVGDGELKILDKKTLQRLEDLEKLQPEDKNNIYYTLDNLIKAAKLKAL